MEWRRTSPPGIRVVRLGGLGLLAVLVGLVADRLLLPLAVRGFIRGTELLMNACVWLALSLSAGMSAWSIVAVVGRAAVGLVGTRQASVALGGVVVVGVLAAYGLQRVLGSGGDPGGH
jgi:hypothetical protein